MRERNKQISFWMKDSEFENLKNKADKCGLSVSSFIRQCINKTTFIEKPGEEFYESINVLRNLSNNLNQIAVKAHIYGYIEEEKYFKEVNKLEEFIMEVKRKILLNKNKG